MVAREQWDMMDDAGRGNNLVCGVTVEIEPGRRTRHNEINGPDVQAGHDAHDLSVVKVHVHAAELDKLGQLHSTIADTDHWFCAKRASSLC